MIKENPITVLLAEDNEDDLWLMQQALKKAHLPNPAIVVRNGAQAIDYLAGNGKYADRDQYPFPFVLLLDLKMPVKDGFEVMEWWRSQPRKQHLRIIVLTSSERRVDIERAYALGAITYLCKPSELVDLSEMVERILHYWSIVQPVGPMVEIEGGGIRLNLPALSDDDTCHFLLLDKARRLYLELGEALEKVAEEVPPPPTSTPSVESETPQKSENS